jgi:hypothetical protein
MRILLFIIIGIFLAGGSFTACKKHATEPPTDTSHKPCDTCNKPCDTCNLNKDSLAHAFTWQQLTIPQEASLTGVWVFGPNDILIVGNSLWHYNGSTFSLQPAYDLTHHFVPMNGALNGSNIFALSRTDFWMVYAGLAYHTTDGSYFEYLIPTGGIIRAEWGTSSSDMFFVGDTGCIFHYDGTTFTKMTSNTKKDLRSVWGTSHNDVWATGWNSSKGETVLMHYDGNSWSEDQFSSSGTINKYAIGTVWACDSIAHSIAVIAGTRVFHKTDNGVWRGDTSEVGNSLGGGSYIGIGAYGGTSSDLFAIGSWGFISHWNGKTWYQYKQFFDYSNNDYYGAAFSMNGNTACVVGTKGGASWVAIGTRKQ